MTQRISKLPLFSAGILIAVSSLGQSYNTVSERTRKVIDSTYTALIKKNHVVGASLAIVDNGEIVYAAGYGFSDEKNKVKADEHTIYRIGSCTKSFSALSILQLQEKKLLDVNRSVKEYLPDLTITSRFNDDNQIYVKDMLSHVSGLPCDIGNGFFCDSPPDIKWEIAELNKQTTMSPRQYLHAYSNVAYGLLGEVIARTGKTTYSEYVKNNIFVPLNMTSSYIEVDEKLVGRFSKAYVDKKEIKEPLIRDQAAGLIHSDVIDMANYVRMYLGRGKAGDTRIISEASVLEMEKNQLTNTLLSKKSNWGYGLYTKTVMVRKDKDSTVARIVGHGGDTYAFHADFGYMPELNVGVVVLTNTDRGTSINSATSLLKIYLKEAKGQKLDTKYKAKDDTSAYNPGEVQCAENDILGEYNFGAFTMKVKDEKKMSFKQGPATVVLKQKKTDPKNYSVKARMFNIVPVKIKDQELTYVKMNDNTYLKVIHTKSKKYEYIGTRNTPVPVSAAWKSRLGNYKVAGTVYKCEGCIIGDPQGMSMKLAVKDGLLCMTTKAKSKGSKDSVYLDIISDELSVTGGIGRGTGETVRLLANGNIYYSGFEFEKMK